MKTKALTTKNLFTLISRLSIIGLVGFFELIGLNTAYSQDCNAILNHGIYNYDDLKTNVQYRRDYLNYLYKADFKSAKEATDAGIDLSLPIPGTDIILGGSGVFHNDKYREWRSEYEKQITENITLNTTYSRVRQYIDNSIIKAWTECLYIAEKAKEKGVITTLVPVDDEKVEFRATWIAYPGVEHTRLTDKLEINGGIIITPAASNVFKKTHELVSKDESIFIKRIIGKTLTVTIRTNNGNKTERFPAPPEGVISNFTANNTNIYLGETVVINWQSLKVHDLRINGQAVNESGSQTFTPVNSTTYILTGKGVFNQSLHREVTITVVPRPLTVVAGYVTFTVPAWADGKDDDTNFSYQIKTLDGTLISEGNRGSENDKCEIPNPGHLDIPFVLKTQDIKTLSVNSLNRIHFYFQKKPNGHDGVTFLLSGTLILSDNTLCTFGYGDPIRLQDNGPQNWDNILSVNVPPTLISTANSIALINQSRQKLANNKIRISSVRKKVKSFNPN